MKLLKMINLNVRKYSPEENVDNIPFYFILISIRRSFWIISCLIKKKATNLDRLKKTHFKAFSFY